jgi:hypothetical protein
MPPKPTIIMTQVAVSGTAEVTVRTPNPVSKSNDEMFEPVAV